ncbi:hypothetical protein RHAL1_02117 [Beijerinckiaceae bacterium RH AL1]|nr:hypothetical protein RHCH11_RHCH11_02074 [Beijerinckiaceae bacterium RH CH11]VVB46183.1 hypothetical protein RHAL8_02070 [Beijerinckiaceae bacterium RH AL8]VVC55203.1 hypothetical protein RHAL1_02117 [Beijerinckiaceae bacterium RH AL1]
MRRMRFVRFVVRLARAFDTRLVTAPDDAPIDPALLPLDLATQPMTFH